MPLSGMMKERLSRALDARRFAVVRASHEQLSVGMGPLINLLSSSFEGKEVRSGGRELEEKLKDLAYRRQMPVIGPNILGVSSFARGQHGIFWHLDAKPGPVAIITQSCGVGLTIGFCLRSLECGVSQVHMRFVCTLLLKTAPQR